MFNRGKNRSVLAGLLAVGLLFVPSIQSSGDDVITPGSQYLNIAPPREGEAIGDWAKGTATGLAADQLNSRIDLWATPSYPTAADVLGTMYNRIDGLARGLAADTAKQTIGNAIDDLLLNKGANFGLDKTRLLDLTLNGLAQTSEAVLDHSSIAGFANMEIRAGVGSNQKPSYSILTVQPLYEDEASRHNVFAQGGLGYRFDNFQNRTTLNLGLGYRYLTPNEKWLYGTNIFYDHEFPYDHQRISIGAEAESSLYRMGANYYHGVSGWQNSRKYYQERALNGADLELAGRLAFFPQLELAVRGTIWDRLEGEKDIRELAVRGEYTPVPAISVRVEGRDDTISKPALEASVGFKYNFGMPLADQFKPVTTAQLLSVKARRFDLVERQNIIKVQERQHPNTVGSVTAVAGNNTINGVTATLGMTVMFGATIIVEDTAGDTSSVTITFGDGAVLQIGDDSTVTIAEGTITLVTGVMRYTSNGSTRILNTPNAKVTLSGTVVELYYEGTSDTAARVTSGAISMLVAGVSIDRSATSAACSASGVSPVSCTTGNTVYGSMDTAVNTRLPSGSGVDLSMVPPMTTINAAGQSYRKGCTDIPPGTGTNNDASCSGSEQPEHTITFASSFEIGTYEVTWDDYQKCVDDGGCATAPVDDGYGQGTRPVTKVSWNDITNEYIPWLNGKTGRTYRLPTESEWEYVARAGSNTVYPWGAAAGGNNANCENAVCGDAFANTSPAGSFAANAYGVYDMIGNVWEWTQDLYQSPYPGTPTDGTAYTAAGANRVLRGGSWINNAVDVRSADRSYVDPTNRGGIIGFRLARTI